MSATNKTPAEKAAITKEIRRHEAVADQTHRGRTARDRHDYAMAVTVQALLIEEKCGMPADVALYHLGSATESVLRDYRTGRVRVIDLTEKA
jgi:hypothetical protein